MGFQSCSCIKARILTHVFQSLTLCFLNNAISQMSIDGLFQWTELFLVLWWDVWILGGCLISTPWLLISEAPLPPPSPLPFTPVHTQARACVQACAHTHTHTSMWGGNSFSNQNHPESLRDSPATSEWRMESHGFQCFVFKHSHDTVCMTQGKAFDQIPAAKKMVACFKWSWIILKL